MSWKIIISGLALLTLASPATPPAAGTISEIVPFEKFTESGVENSGLADHAGKIIILSYFTPW